MYNARWIILILCLIVREKAIGQTLTIEEVMRRAADRARRDPSLKVAMAAAQEQLIEAQSKFRIELRPRLALFTFTNPALLAASLGAGLLLGREAPPPWVRQHARLDRIAAEIAAHRTVTAAERAASRAYFHFAVLQLTRDRLAELLHERRKEQMQVRERVRSARLTSVDLATSENDLIALELQLGQAEYERSLAAVDLGSIIGQVESPAELRPADLPRPEITAPVPTVNVLFRMSFQKPGVAAGLKASLEKERNLLHRDPRMRGVALSLAYAHMNDGPGSKLGVGSGGFLLGGHSGTLDLGFRVALRKTGESAAIATSLAAKIATLEYELVRVEEESRQEIQSLRLLASFSMGKAELLERRMRLAEAALPVATRREKAGLASTDAVYAAGSELNRLRTEYRQAKAEGAARWVQLLTAAGLDWKQVSSQHSLLTAMKDSNEDSNDQ